MHDTSAVYETRHTFDIPRSNNLQGQSTSTMLPQLTVYDSHHPFQQEDEDLGYA